MSLEVTRPPRQRVSPTRDPRPTPSRRTRPSNVARLLLSRKAALLGVSLCALVVVCAAFAPVIAPYDPLKIEAARAVQRPSAVHWLGTDALGRDVLSRLIYGARVSITVGAIAVLIAVLVGIPCGLVSGFYGGWREAVLMRLMDGLAAFPAILLALGILTALGPDIRNAMLAIGVVYVPAFSRVMRGSVLTIRNNEYVDAARACGASNAYILLRTVFPNCVSPLLVHMSLGFANAIIIEAALGFLGLGTQPPTPSWGAMLNESRQYLAQNVWYAIGSGLAIFLTVLGLNLFGDSLRDILDPRLRRL